MPVVWKVILSTSISTCLPLSLVKERSESPELLIVDETLDGLASLAETQLHVRFILENQMVLTVTPDS
jgi:hypothetical protein